MELDSNVLGSLRAVLRDDGLFDAIDDEVRSILTELRNLKRSRNRLNFEVMIAL